MSEPATQSLAELKAEIEALEKAENPEAKVEAPKVEVQSEEQELKPEAEVVEGENQEVSQDWMKSDEEEDENNKPRFTNSDAARIKNKYKGRLKQEKDENERLREEKAALEKQIQEYASKPVPITNEPKREQFKTDAEYQRALTVHLINERDYKLNSEQAAAKIKADQERQQQAISKATEEHYARRAELAKKSNISEEAMGEAERNFRMEMDKVMPERGDIIVDQLISRLGKGSEMVIHKLGISRAAREKAAECLRDDPSGLSLAVYVGGLKETLSAPMRRESRAPEPATRLHPDKTNSASGSKYKKDFDAAMDAGDAQKAWNIKREAMKKKVPVAGW